MATTRLDMSVFDGKVDFGVWQKKMKALLTHHKVAIALEKDLEKWPEASKARKSEIDDEAYSLLILNLSDGVLRKVDGEDTPLKLWSKLASIFQAKSSSNLAFLKGSLFGYKMDPSKSIDENLDELLKMTLVLKGTDLALSETSLSMILLNSIPENYQVVKDAFQYTGTMPSFDLIVTGLKTREIELKNQKRSGTNLFVKSKQDAGTSSGSNKSKKHSKSSKSDTSNKTESRKCYYCNKTGHIKKDCYKFLNKNKQTNPKWEKGNSYRG